MRYEDFKDIFMSVLDRHAVIMEKRIRGNNAPFMNKTLSKAFMHRSRLRNNFNKSPTEGNKSLYNKQRNFCVSLLKKEKRKYYNNLDVKIFDINKTFWKRIEPLFPDKQRALPRNITLVEGNEITSNKKEVAEKFNNFFVNAVANLDIEPYISADIPCNNIKDIIAMYKCHPSIKK